LAAKIDALRTSEKERKIEPPCALHAHALPQHIEQYRLSIQSIIGATLKRQFVVSFSSATARMGSKRGRGAPEGRLAAPHKP
jgi:hypothetical protein